MTRGWCVRVSVFDDLVVSISERELCGRDLSEDDKDLIRGCAQHLLSFVGDLTTEVTLSADEAAKLKAQWTALKLCPGYRRSDYGAAPTCKYCGQPENEHDAEEWAKANPNYRTSKA